MAQTSDREAVRAYAAALYELGADKNDIDRARDMLGQTPQLRRVLDCPVTDLKQKLACVDRIFPESLHAFMKVVCTHNRTALLEDIFEAWEDYSRRMRGILKAQLYCVTPPESGQLEGIRRRLCRKFNVKDVQIDIHRDPSLIGGFIIEAGGCVMDYSIRGRFAQLEQKLTRR